MLSSIRPWRAMLLLVPLVLPACAESQLFAHGLKGATASTAPAGHYKVGKPYQIEGVWYYPAEDWSYDETGIASWYGPTFHGKQTANGETFDQNEVTAAHRTLPLPVLVRVTNLENGRSLVVRVNDRGPYAHGRIIDLSRRSAQLLGFEGQGMAKVRVQIMADESRAMIASGSEPGSPNPEAAPQAMVTAEALPPPPRADKPRQESPPPPAQASQRQDPPQQARPVPAVLAQPLE
ncbi:MAG: septal ring lytic transglycosylase RlpA family protein, partial [Alphaproteobacteria bacterium]|nr:septal ring lytic transglycosylase RlpA family protein [Alphaproteobacteria bacterium]